MSTLPSTLNLMLGPMIGGTTQRLIAVMLHRVSSSLQRYTFRSAKLDTGKEMILLSWRNLYSSDSVNGIGIELSIRSHLIE